MSSIALWLCHAVPPPACTQINPCMTPTEGKGLPRHTVVLHFYDAFRWMSGRCWWTTSFSLKPTKRKSWNAWLPTSLRKDSESRRTRRSRFAALVLLSASRGLGRFFATVSNPKLHSCVFAEKGLRSSVV